MAWTTSAYLRARPILVELGAAQAKAALLLKFLVLKYVLRASAPRLHPGFALAAPLAVFGFLTLTFLFLTIGALGGASGMTTFGGWLGIITAALAWYTALAGVLAGTNSAIKLPTFPMG